MALFPEGAPAAGDAGVNDCGGLGDGVNPGVFAVERPTPRGNGAVAGPVGTEGCAGFEGPWLSSSGAGGVSDSSACTNGMTASCALITALRMDVLIRFKRFSF